MAKRSLDLGISLVGLVILSPLLITTLIIIWAQDFGNPFYISERVGLNGKKFKIYKLRSMILDADKSGVDSTSDNDSRITKVGMFIRKFKLDEVSQLINVLFGNMSLVGPRPNVEREVNMYTSLEMKLLSIKPGITDYSSIIFSDEGYILKDHPDPDIGYHQLIRPGKGALAYFYMQKNNIFIDIKLILITAISIVSRSKALKMVSKLLLKMGASESLVNLALRKDPLTPKPPFGASELVLRRK